MEQRESERHAGDSSNHIPDANVVDLRPRTAPPASPKLKRPRPLPEFSNFQRPETASRPAPRPAARPVPSRPSLSLKQVQSFALLTLAVLLPVLIVSGTRPLRAWEHKMSASSSRGLSEFAQASDALREYSFDEAAQHFSTARKHFTEAYAELQNARGLTRAVVQVTPLVRGKFEDGQRLLLAGQALSDAGEQLTKSLELLIDQADGAAEGQFPLAGAFLGQAELITESVAEIRTAFESLSRVRPAHLPRPYRQRFAQMQAQLPEIDGRLRESQQLIPFFLSFFGSDRPREYLFLFENDTELRPAGGFIGSLALVRFENGRFSILDAPPQGPAAIDDNLPVSLLPPQPILAVAPYWTMHDANWFVDVPTSARKVLSFYEQVRGFKVDGVVAMTPRVIERLLQITGPLEMPKYGLVLSRENFLRTTQEQVELKYDPAAFQPKQFVVDLIPALLTKISSLPPEKAVPLISSLEESLMTKDLLFWVKEAEQAERIRELGWDGAVPDADGDVLAIVDANLGGGKSSRVIRREVELDVRTAGGTLDNTLTIRFTHAGNPEDLWTGHDYQGYVKVYLPAGSQLLDASGFDRLPPAKFMTPPAEAQPDTDLVQIEKSPLLDESSGTRTTSEFGLLAVGNWLTLKTGEQQTVTLRYRSGAPLLQRQSGRLYDLTVIKQPGAEPYDLTVRVSRNAGLRLSSVPVQQSKTAVQFRDTIIQDQHYLLMFKK